MRLLDDDFGPRGSSRRQQRRSRRRHWRTAGILRFQRAASPVSPRPLGFLVTRLHAFFPPRSSYFHRNLLSPLSLCRDTYTRPESERHKLVTRRWVYLQRTLRRCCMVWYVSSNCVWLTNLTCLLVIHGNLSDITRWSCGVFGVRICEFPVFHYVTYGNLQCCLYSIVQIGRDTIISRQLGCLIDQQY